MVECARRALMWRSGAHCLELNAHTVYHAVGGLRAGAAGRHKRAACTLSKRGATGLPVGRPATPAARPACRGRLPRRHPLPSTASRQLHGRSARAPAGGRPGHGGVGNAALQLSRCRPQPGPAVRWPLGATGPGGRDGVSPAPAGRRSREASHDRACLWWTDGADLCRARSARASGRGDQPADLSHRAWPGRVRAAAALCDGRVR